MGLCMKLNQIVSLDFVDCFPVTKPQSCDLQTVQQAELEGWNA